MKSSHESNNPSTEYLDKQRQWNREIEVLQGITDRLGQPIDENIKEAVVAFNVNGFSTYMSCEGHVEERFGEVIKISPYVGFGMPEPDIRFDGQEEIKRKIAEEFGVNPVTIGLHLEEGNEKADTAYWDYIQNNFVPETAEFIQVRNINEQLAKIMQELLNEFYSTRETSEELKLKIDIIGPASHVAVSCGRDVSNLSEVDLDKYKKELKEEQKEMNNFAEFLKQKFFENATLGVMTGKLN
jgi:hypothetical protein